MESVKKKVLVTGGAGFVGSSCVIELVSDGFEIVIADNYATSSTECIKRIEIITGEKVNAQCVDLRDRKALDELFGQHRFHAVLHLAAVRAKFGESFEDCLKYYDNNVTGTINLLQCMQTHGVTNMIYSSDAAVYGAPKDLPVTEKHECDPKEIQNSYVRSKYLAEQIVQDFHKNQKNWNVIILRYFEAVGAHASGLLGEDLKAMPSNLVTGSLQCILGTREFIYVSGNDHETHDGTGLRDYIHVTDLAKGHSCALKKLLSQDGDLRIYNLSMGRGYTVFDVIEGMEKETGKTVEYKVFPRHPLMTSALYADPALAKQELDWACTKNLDDICADAYNWYSCSPHGY